MSQYIVLELREWLAGQVGLNPANEYYIHLLSAAADEMERLDVVLSTARAALDSCRAGVTPLVRDGFHAQTTNAAAEQFSAAWRDLTEAVEAAERR